MLLTQAIDCAKQTANQTGNEMIVIKLRSMPEYEPVTLNQWRTKPDAEINWERIGDVICPSVN